MSAARSWYSRDLCSSVASWIGCNQFCWPFCWFWEHLEYLLLQFLSQQGHWTPPLYQTWTNHLKTNPQKTSRRFLQMPCQMKRCVANMCSGHCIVSTTARAVSDDIGNVLHRNVRADFWLFSRSQKWQIWLEILKKVRFFRLFVAIVPEESRKSEKTTSENRPIVTGLRWRILLKQSGRF